MNDDSKNSINKIFKPGLFFFIVAIISTLIQPILGSIIVSIMGEDSFGGLSGLALALALRSILFPLSMMLVGVLVWRWLKKNNYKYPLLTSVLGVVSMLAFVYILESLAMVISSALEDNVGLAVLLMHTLYVLFFTLIFLLYFAVFNFLKVKKRTVILAAVFLMISMVAGSLAMSYFSHQRYMQERTDRAINRGFDVYEVQYEDIETRYLRRDSRQYVRSRLDTPEGSIRISQAGVDEVIEKLLIAPERCNYDALRDYIGPLGTTRAERLGYMDDYTSLPCRVVYEEEGRLLLTPDYHEEGLGVAPYIGKIGNTVIVFHAYTSTIGNFQGTKEEAAYYIIEFMKNARVITDEELGLVE